MVELTSLFLMAYGYIQRPLELIGILDIQLVFCILKSYMNVKLEMQTYCTGFT